MIIFIYWFSISFIVYTYIGYPLFLWLLSIIKSLPVKKSVDNIDKTVSIILSLYNEELNIHKKILNLLEQTYDQDKLEIIIVSDGSTDKSDEIVQGFVTNELDKNDAHIRHSIKFIRIDNNQGKPNALNMAVSVAKGEIIVFSDTRQTYDSNAIKELIGNFDDEKIGSVSGELIFIDCHSNMTIDMGLYWNFEKIIRKMESSTGSVMGATGAIYAIRKELYNEIPKDTLIDDVMIPMDIVMQGYRNIFDSKAIAYDTISTEDSQEKRRKIRTLAGNYQLIQKMPDVLSPIKNPDFIRYISHKVFRLFVPFFLCLLVLSAFLLDGRMYDIVFYGIVVSLLLPIVDDVFPFLLSYDCKGINSLKKISGICRTFYYFNYYALLAFLYYIGPKKGKRIW